MDGNRLDNRPSQIDRSLRLEEHKLCLLVMIGVWAQTSLGDMVTYTKLTGSRWDP